MNPKAGRLPCQVSKRRRDRVRIHYGHRAGGAGESGNPYHGSTLPRWCVPTKLITSSLDVRKGGTMKGNITHTGGKFTSNDVQVDDHDHGGVRSGDDRTVGTK